MITDITQPLKERVRVPAHLTWGGEESYLEVGELVIRIPHETAPRGQVRVMTLAGPMAIPETAIASEH